MFEIGNTLREARLRRGLDILDCEAETKIRAKYLRAMEEEQFDLMPSPTYVRGFLRTYADFLDLDGRLVLDEYESRFGELRHLSEAGPRSARQARGPRGSSSRPDARRPPPTPMRRRNQRRRRTEVQLLWLAIGGVMAVALLIWMGVGETRSGAQLPVTAPGGPTAGAPAPTASAPDTDSTERPVRAKKTAITLTGDGTNGCWVQVRSKTADGRLVYEGTLAPGESRTFRVLEGIWLRAANPAELAVTIGGKAVSLDASQSGTWRLTPNGVKSAA
ncbi:helix-turn-helix domain-containing protein [Miltoncostaea marina]|uniref:helix-turn-helix domain-containing protein n=1 Tax=Miltoncostaea marina TaxID=2843215 RepID=UPI001C3D40F4|nr:helix-turn-helix domain-containing protein [Miltoncostaea marina]